MYPVICRDAMHCVSTTGRILPDCERTRSGRSNPEEGELIVKGQTIEVSSSTKFNGTTTSFSSLTVGQKITAKGKLQTDGKINAKVIRTK